jgi:hypothetical protein
MKMNPNAPENRPIAPESPKRDGHDGPSPEQTKRHELLEKALSETKVLHQSVRQAVPDSARQARLRDLLAAIESELQKQYYESL